MITRCSTYRAAHLINALNLERPVTEHDGAGHKVLTVELPEIPLLKVEKLARSDIACDDRATSGSNGESSSSEVSLRNVRVLAFSGVMKGREIAIYVGDEDGDVSMIVVHRIDRVPDCWRGRPLMNFRMLYPRPQDGRVFDLEEPIEIMTWTVETKGGFAIGVSSYPYSMDICHEFASMGYIQKNAQQGDYVSLAIKVVYATEKISGRDGRYLYVVGTDIEGAGTEGLMLFGYSEADVSYEHGTSVWMLRGMKVGYEVRTGENNLRPIACRYTAIEDLSAWSALRDFFMYRDSAADNQT